MTKPLEGIRILEWAIWLAGPGASMMLGDMGADIIKIESPFGGDDSRTWAPPYVGAESAYYLSCNRNKKSITLNLRSEGGKRIFTDLIKSSDIVVENFRPGVMKKIGFTYEIVKAINPKIIFCSITAFGNKGPDSQKAGFDLIAQGMGGFMSLTGEVGGQPLKVGVAIADINAGMFAAYGILLALYHRERTGEGQRVETSLFETMVAELTFHAARFFATGTAPKPEGNRHPLIVPYESFPCRDGHLNIAAANDNLFVKLCLAMGLQKIEKDPRFENNELRVKNRDVLVPILKSKTKDYNLKDLQKVLDQAGIPNGPIWSLDQTLTSEQAMSLELVRELDHPTCGRIRVTGIPVKLSTSPGDVVLPPPTLGQHTQEVLTEIIGYSDAEIDRLKQDGAI